MAMIEIEGFYGHESKMRYGGSIPPHPGIKQILDARKSSYEELVKTFGDHLDAFHSLSLTQKHETTPFWENGFFPVLDIVVLYSLIARHRPRKLIEVGSGSSTKVAHLCRSNLDIPLEITSIDPFPRAEIDTICDRVIRAPLQDCDLTVFSTLEPGDFLFFDGSHRVLQNSDNQVLFFEILPNLKPGVIVQIHDIFWPNDYPEEWTKRYYNEQYVLGSILLYAPESLKVMFPSAYASYYCDLAALREAICNRPGFESIAVNGCSFWFEKT